MFLFSVLLTATSITHNQIYGYFYSKTLTIHIEKHTSRLQTALHQFSTSFAIKIFHFSQHLGFGSRESVIVTCLPSTTTGWLLLSSVPKVLMHMSLSSHQPWLLPVFTLMALALVPRRTCYMVDFSYLHTHLHCVRLSLPAPFCPEWAPWTRCLSSLGFALNSPDSPGAHSGHSSALPRAACRLSHTFSRSTQNYS